MFSPIAGNILIIILESWRQFLNFVTILRLLVGCLNILKLMFMSRLLLLLLLGGFMAALQAQESRSGIRVTDMLQIKRAGGVEFSPDGSHVLYTVQSTVLHEKNPMDHDYRSQLWMVDASGATAPRPLTSGKTGFSQASFSPDGTAIVFVRSVDGKSQLFLLPLAGGEPIQLTDHPYGASNPKWRPDGKQLLFSASLSLAEVLADSLVNPGMALPDWNFEKPGFTDNSFLIKSDAKPDPDGSLAEIRAYLAKNEIDNKAKVFNKLNFQTETSTSSALRFSHLYVMDAVPGATPRALTRGFRSHGSPEFVGINRVLYTVGGPEGVHPDRAQGASIRLLHLDTGADTEFRSNPGYNVSLSAVSPSGRFVAYQESEIGTPRVPKLYVLPIDDVQALPVYIEFDRNKSNVQWNEDESALYFVSPSNGGSVLCRAQLANGRVERLSSEDEGISSYDLHGRQLVFAKNDVLHPSDLYVAEGDMVGNARRLTDLNGDWLALRELSIPEKYSFTNELGLEVEYWVMKPIGFEAGKTYPLLLQIHGGPSAMWGPGEASMWHEFQYFCAQGYGVVYSNPRGSGGYGEAFLRANMDDWGAGPAGDVLGALDRTIAQGWADTSKLVISGGSYAGYLVSWIIAHDQRFAAACSQRGVYDLRTFFGEGNAWRLVPSYFGGYPWDPAVYKTLERESPINYVDRIKTPYIIFHGEQDLRTGVIQSEMLYKSLKVLERPVEYVRHPGAGHEITRSGDNRQRIDQMLRTYEFFERWVR